MAFTPEQKREYRARLRTAKGRGAPAKRAKYKAHSGRSGKSGKSGPSGYAKAHNEKRRLAAREDLRSWILACLPDTVGKLAGSEAKRQCLASVQRQQSVCNIRNDLCFEKHMRLEINHELDTASLGLYHACTTVRTWARKLAILWLVRMVFNTDGCLDPFFAAYRAAAGSPFWSHFDDQSLRAQSVVKALAALKLGVATANSRLKQWTALRKECGKVGPYFVTEEAGACFAQLVNRGKFHAAAPKIATLRTEAAANDLFHSLSARADFLKYLLYRDLRVLANANLPPSTFVGWGARDILADCSKGLVGDNGPGAAELEDLISWLQKRLPKYWIKMVCPRGWDAPLTQHQCCEKRRWDERASGQQSKGGRRCRDSRQEAVSSRQVVRAKRLQVLYKFLGFRKKPLCARALKILARFP